MKKKLCIKWKKLYINYNNLDVKFKKVYHKWKVRILAGIGHHTPQISNGPSLIYEAFQLLTVYRMMCTQVEPKTQEIVISNILTKFTVLWL
jgi:hypothetical protein